MCLTTTGRRARHGAGQAVRRGRQDRDGKRCVIFQVWDFVGDIYDLSMYFVVDDTAAITPVLR